MSDFDEYRRDWQSIACQRTLDVYRRSPVLRSVQTAIINQVQELFDAAIDSLGARTLDGAQGRNLEVIGRLVGAWPRPLQNAEDLVYFGPDNGYTAPDYAPVYTTGAPLYGQVPINDVDYRKFIRAQIAKSYVKYGSAPELQYWAKFAYGVTLSIKNIGLSELRVVFSAGTPAHLVSEVLAVRDDETADGIFNLPIPTTARIAEVAFKPHGAFAPDLKTGAPDLARAGVSYVFNP